MSRRNRSILVTGGCGYIGSALIRHLAMAGVDEIRILDNFSRGTPDALRGLPSGPRYRFFEADILNRDVLRLALQDVDVAVHLAALSQAPLSFALADRLEQVNHWGTAGLVEECIAASVRRSVYVSTSAVYEPGHVASEDATCRPFGPYAQSAFRAEEALRTADGRGVASTVLRVGTVYGTAPATRFDEFVNRFAYLAGTAQTVTIHGDGTQLRPIIHVDDVCDAILFALQNEERRARTFNHNGETLSVADVASMVVSCSKSARIRYTEQDVRTRYSFAMNDAKIRALGWAPQRMLADGIRELVESFGSFEPPLATAYDVTEGLNG